MKLNILNQSKVKIPTNFLSLWIQCFEVQLKMILKRQKKHERKVKNLNRKTLNLVFVSEKKMLDLNLKFRKKKKISDSLSFSSPMSHLIGEIVLCPSYIKKTSHLDFNQNLAYLTLHAFLHLLGFEHEFNPKKAKMMYSIQDEIFFKNIKKVETQWKKWKIKRK